jgi:hypothetical protein
MIAARSFGPWRDVRAEAVLLQCAWVAKIKAQAARRSCVTYLTINPDQPGGW